MLHYKDIAKSDSLIPILPQNSGDICGTGTYCPEGSGVETDCEAGTFNTQQGKEAFTYNFSSRGGGGLEMLTVVDRGGGGG